MVLSFSIMSVPERREMKAQDLSIGDSHRKKHKSEEKT